MLIAQVFTVMTVYQLRGGQNGYRGNVINFPQDIKGFTDRLPRNPTSLDVLVVRQQSANEPTAFRNFVVRREKVASALLWLKRNNRYYKDIIIDDEILQSLPANGSIIHQLPQIRNDQTIDDNTIEDDNEDDNEYEAISHTFVPASPPTH